MSYELQLLDCNCNDCKFMQRDMNRFQKSLDFHKSLQLNEFERKKRNLLDLAKYYHREEGDLDKFQTLSDQASKMKFQFDKSFVKINYGYCQRLGKDISFIPNQLQLETQHCFEHRKQID